MRLLFTLLTIISITKVYAQYTITPSQKPNIGDTYSYISLDTVNIINGSSGTNQVWNYTNLVIPATPTVLTTSYVDASTAITNYTWYPGAYMAIAGPGGFTSFDNDPNNYSLNWTKTTLGGATSTKYTDPLTKYHYPISFGSIFSDSVKFGAYDEQPPSTGYVGPYLSYGVNSYTCAGYGTLNLPNGVSLPNTLKLNIQYFKTYVEQINPNVNGHDSAYYEEYFNPISKFPILAFYKLDGTSIIPNTNVTIVHHDKSIYLNTIVIASLKDLEKTSVDVTVFPNPASRFNIEIHSQNNTEERVFLVKNALGQEIETTINPISNAHYTLDMKNNIPGIYFLTIKTQKGQVTKKLLVQ